MKLGAEPKKAATLAVLLAVAAFLIYRNMSTGDSGRPGARASTPPAAANRARPSPVALQPPRNPAQPSSATQRARQAVEEFRPSLKPKRPEDRPDPMTVDPTLRLELLARLQSVRLSGTERNLFEFSQAPPPKVPEPKILPKPVNEEAKSEEPKAAETSEAKPPKPPPPPVPFKFYGFISSQGGGPRRGFFLEGEDIFVAGEGELIKKRYKIVRIGLTSAVVRDTEHDHEQTVAIVPQPAG